MLLRSSRAAEHLDKEAFIQTLGRVGQTLGRIGRTSRRTGEFFAKNNWRWGKRLGGGALLGLATVPMLGEAAKRSHQGMSEEAFQLRQQGLLPSGPPNLPRV